MSLTVFELLAFGGVALAALSFLIGLLVGKSGAWRILDALEKHQYRAELFAIRATRQRLKEVALAINHEMDCHNALEVARRAYRGKNID